MLKIEVDGDKGTCGRELCGRGVDLIAEMHAAIGCFARSIMEKRIKDGGERDVAMKMEEGFATAVRDAYKEVMEAKTNAD